MEQIDHSIESTNFEIAESRMKEQYAQLDMMRKSFEQIELTRVISDHHLKRLDAMRSINHQVKSGRCRTKHEKMVDGLIVGNWFDSKAKDFSKANQDVLSNIINGLLKDVETDVVLSASISSLKWGELFVELSQTQQAFAASRLKRNVDLSEVDLKKIDAAKCRKESDAALKILMDVIQQEYTFHQKESVLQLIIALNKVFDRSRTIAKSAATKRRLAREREAEKYRNQVKSLVDLSNDMPYVRGPFSKITDRPANFVHSTSPDAI